MQSIDRQVVPKRRYGTTTQRCIKSYKNIGLIYFAADAWYHARSLHVSIYSAPLLCSFL